MFFNLKQFLQEIIHHKGYKATFDSRDNIEIKTEEQLKQVFQSLLQLEQYQEVLRLYCSTEVSTIRAWEKTQSSADFYDLIYETLPRSILLGEVQRGELYYAYSKGDIKAHSLLFRFARNYTDTHEIRCLVKFTVLPNSLVKQTCFGKIKYEDIILIDVQVLKFNEGFNLSIINKTLQEGLLGIPYKEF